MKKPTKNRARQIADIDLSEMPEVLDWSGAEIGKFYRPPKKPVTMGWTRTSWAG